MDGTADLAADSWESRISIQGRRGRFERTVTSDPLSRNIEQKTRTIFLSSKISQFSVYLQLIIINKHDYDD